MRAPRENRYRTAWAGELRADDVGGSTRVAGWVHRRRDHGGLIFIDLRDRSGLLQLVFHPESAPDAHAAAGRLRAEDVVTVAGEIVARGEGADALQAFRIARAVRSSGQRTEMEQAGRSLKGQLKHASRIGARAVVVVEGDGLRLRDMRTRDERPVAGEHELVEALERMSWA